MSGNKVVTNIDNNCINSEDTNELFMITTESELTFQNHINKLCKKYKISNNMSPAILNNIFARSATPYNLHNPANLKMRKVHLVLRLYPI